MAASLLPYAVAVPLLVAAALLPLDKILPRVVADAAATLTALFVTCVGVDAALASRTAPIVYWFGNWRPHNGVALGISFAADPLGAGLAAFIGLLVTLAFAFSWRYFDSAGTLFHTLMLVFLAAMTGFALTGDIFNLFVFFELMSVAAFALAGYKIEEKQSIQGAINFAVTNSIGAFLVLFGIALLYGRTGALNMAQIGNALAHERPDGLLVVACALILCGFLVKGAVVPFHFWLDDAHAVAPTPLCVLFSGVMVQLSLYAVARIYGVIFARPFHGHDHQFVMLLIAAGVVTALLGSVLAFAQPHLKRMLAFSTISHSGMFLCGIAALSPLGLQADEVFVVAHGLVKASLFMSTGIVLQRRGSVNVAQLAGRCRSMWPTAVLFVVGGLALAGLPPFGISAGKALLDRAMDEAGAGWLAFVFGLASALDGAAVLRAAGCIFFGFGKGDRDDGKTPAREVREGQASADRTPLPMVLSASVALALALACGPLTHALDLRAVGETLACAALAAVLAIAAWNVDFTMLRRSVAWLRACHDGIFTDYVLWLVAGVAVYGAVLLPIASR